MGVARALALTCLLGAVTAHAAPVAGLWSERPAGTPLLTQVPDLRAVAAQIVPAVVSIQVEGRARPPSPHGGGGEGPDFFHRYFGGPLPHPFANRGLGSGFVLAPAGLILTNYHVVEDAETIEVTLQEADGSDRKLAARVLGVAPRYDVALLQTCEPLQAPVAYLGDSDAAQIGDWAMAVGNPFGLSHSVSVGIISAKERHDIAPSGRQGVYSFLQTDASINPGNSGGPLVNMRGEVIGINSAVNAAGAGIGFAIPINMVKEMLPDLQRRGRFSRSWLGIKVQPLSLELAQSFGLRRPAGALITEVVPDSPAATAGLQEGDIVLAFDGHVLRAASELMLLASMAGSGHAATLTLWRGGSTRAQTLVLGEFPDEPPLPGAPAPPRAEGELGLRVADVTPALRQEFGLEAAAGVVIRDVTPSGPAARAGLRAGDVLLRVGDVAPHSAREVAQQVQAAAPGSLLRFKVVRQGSAVFAALRKPGA